MIIKLKTNYFIYIIYLVINIFLFYKYPIFWFIFFFPILFLFIYIYREINFQKIEHKRRNRIFKLLLNKYPFSSISKNETASTIYNGHNILFKFYCSRISNCNTNHLDAYLEISELEGNLKSLCKIHFHYHKIENKDYISIPKKFGWTNSLKGLTNRSEKGIKEMIIEYEQYLDQKRKNVG